MDEVFDMPEITFNGFVCSKMEITSSGEKHWEDRSKEIFSSIYTSLDDLNLKPDGIGRDGMPYYHVASSTSAFPDVPQMYRPYRDTVFKIIQDPVGTIVFVHGSPREESWYRRHESKSG